MFNENNEGGVVIYNNLNEGKYREVLTLKEGIDQTIGTMMSNVLDNSYINPVEGQWLDYQVANNETWLGDVTLKELENPTSGSHLTMKSPKKRRAIKKMAIKFSDDVSIVNSPLALSGYFESGSGSSDIIDKVKVFLGRSNLADFQSLEISLTSGGILYVSEHKLVACAEYFNIPYVYLSRREELSKGKTHFKKNKFPNLIGAKTRGLKEILKSNSN